MKNITVTLDESMAAWLRVEAAKRGMSVSRFIGDLVHEHMRGDQEYRRAMQQFFSHKPFDFVWADGRRPTREEIHDRALARAELAREAAEQKESK